MILKLCCVAVITAVTAVILKANRPEYVPMCLTAGGILLVLTGFDYLSASLSFIKKFTEQTGIDSSVVRTVFKAVGTGYVIELTAGAVKDLGFDSVADKLVMCGRFIIFALSLPILGSMFSAIISLAGGA